MFVKNQYFSIQFGVFKTIHMGGMLFYITYNVTSPIDLKKIIKTDQRMEALKEAISLLH